MPRLKSLNPQKVKKKIEEFPQQYADNWKHWLSVKKNAPNNLSTVFGDTLRKWQACIDIMKYHKLPLSTDT